MYQTIQFKTTVPNKLIGHLPLVRVVLLIPPLFICFALSPTARAVSPPPDGGYPGGNTAEGGQALFSLTTGGANTAVGFQALFRNTTGVDNAATGWHALFHNINGNRNTANGVEALFHNTTGEDNTANGVEALFSNTTGFENTATGEGALQFNTTGGGNTANGNGALFSNTAGSPNTATGWHALYSNTEGYYNTATGASALLSNTTGQGNTANGNTALFHNTTGGGNTANGFQALQFNTTGKYNIALGFLAGTLLTTGDDNIDIGNLGVAAESDTIRVGTQGTQTNAYMAGIFGTTVPNGVTVVVDPTGHLGTIVSSQRFKDAIKPMDKASEAILALKPVTFYYKKELDPEGIPQFGLVAEEVEKVNPALVARDAKGKIYTVRYEAVNAMLLNEFLKEHRKVEAQEATITQLKSTVAQQQKDFQAIAANQQKQIEALTAGLQKVSTQVEMSRPAPQTALNDR